VNRRKEKRRKWLWMCLQCDLELVPGNHKVKGMGRKLTTRTIAMNDALDHSGRHHCRVVDALLIRKDGVLDRVQC
jgi:hypothetical protein